MFQINNITDFRKYKDKNKDTFDINKQDFMGNTILHRAVMIGNSLLAKEILLNNTDHLIKNIEGLSPVFYIHRIKKEKDLEEMLEVFIDALGPSIFTIFDKDQRNILVDKSIQKAVTKIQNKSR